MNIQVPFSAFSSFNADKHYFVNTLALNTEDNTCYNLEDRPIDFAYFNGAGLIYVADETVDGNADDNYRIIYDNMRIDNVVTPVVDAQYDAATNVTNLTWTNTNEGYVKYEVYKDDSLIATVDIPSYTDTAPDVDAVYNVVAKKTLTYEENKTVGTQILASNTAGDAIAYATIDFDAANGVNVTGTFNPGAEGVWIVVKFDKNYAVIGDVHTETITASDTQQTKSYNVGSCGENETVKSFLWNNLNDIIPKIDAAVYPNN